MLYKKGDNKQRMLVAPIVHCTLPFCIELYSLEVLDLAVLVKIGFERVFECDAE